jgi:hypothetical protein
MRYYAEWLDGDYLLLKQTLTGYNHNDVVQRAIRYHALFGSTIVLSDSQMVDFRVGIPTLFLDRKFRHFLKERQEKNREDFFALVADPVRGAKDEKFAIAMKGIERLTDQADKPPDSYEMAVSKLGEPIFHAGCLDADRYLDPKHSEKGQIAKVIKKFPQYRKGLRGLLHALDHFSKGSLPTTTTQPAGSPGRYDTLLQKVQNEDGILNEPQANRIQEILRIQQQLPDAQHGRRAAIRHALGTGPWQAETWKPEKLRLYLDVIHAWNCAVNRRIAPEAGTLYESRDDLPLSRYERYITDTADWLRVGPMPLSGPSEVWVAALPDWIRRFLSYDFLKLDWNQIAFIARETWASAMDLQAVLKTGNPENRNKALVEHAKRIAGHLIEPRNLAPEWTWSVAKYAVRAINAANVLPADLADIATEAVELAEVANRDIPYAVALGRQKLVVNTITKAGEALL